MSKLSFGVVASGVALRGYFLAGFGRGYANLGRAVRTLPSGARQNLHNLRHDRRRIVYLALGVLLLLCMSFIGYLVYSYTYVIVEGFIQVVSQSPLPGNTPRSFSQFFDPSNRAGFWEFIIPFVRAPLIFVLGGLLIGLCLRPSSIRLVRWLLIGFLTMLLLIGLNSVLLLGNIIFIAAVELYGYGSLLLVVPLFLYLHRAKLQTFPKLFLRRWLVSVLAVQLLLLALFFAAFFWVFPPSPDPAPFSESYLAKLGFVGLSGLYFVGTWGFILKACGGLARTDKKLLVLAFAVQVLLFMLVAFVFTNVYI